MKLKKTLIFNFILVVVVIFFVGLLQSIDFDNLGKDSSSVDLKSPQISLVVGDTRVNLEVADKNSNRMVGLSGREFLMFDEGMIFVFPVAGIHGFWMKDMNFPIDIAWVDEDFRVVHIENSVLPSTYPKIFRPEVDSNYVIEVVSGFFKSHEIKVGDILILENFL